jgi:hypothetical protein
LKLRKKIIFTVFVRHSTGLPLLKIISKKIKKPSHFGKIVEVNVLPYLPKCKNILLELAPYESQVAGFHRARSLHHSG